MTDNDLPAKRKRDWSRALPTIAENLPWRKLSADQTANVTFDIAALIALAGYLRLGGGNAEMNLGAFVMVLIGAGWCSWVMRRSRR